MAAARRESIWQPGCEPLSSIYFRNLNALAGTWRPLDLTPIADKLYWIAVAFDERCSATSFHQSGEARVAASIDRAFVMTVILIAA
jgi:hypothetical protein